MVELTEDEKKVVEAIKILKATSPESLKTVDQIAKTAIGLPKGKVANLILGLVNKKVVKKITREKAAGYYLIPGAI